jgi:hypothetical protein
MATKRIRNSLGCLIAAWIAVSGLMASEYRGAVKSRGLAFPGATVTAIQGDKKIVTTTDPQGVFDFAELADGTWTIEVEELGFEKIARQVGVASEIYPDRKPSTDFDHNIILADSEITDRSVPTTLYGMYLLNQIVDRIMSADDFYWQIRQLGITQGATYLSSSYWDKEMRYFSPYPALWDIRSSLGKQFTDKLVAYTVRAFGESVHRNVKMEQSTYFYARIKDADDILGDNGASMAVIEKIWKKYNLKIN